ncbi:hypothetical protein J1N35_005438 [Gossypium stocksii]|uniref:Uncharacterized protein n=1 Tax=Gossypium stocksii TaxID=47602 RepID=A0A9D3WEJ0_9ROSI|nr:hypothetical protein J1N35_005438 [Gossypium stocksii]
MENKLTTKLKNERKLASCCDTLDSGTSVVLGILDVTTSIGWCHDIPVDAHDFSALTTFSDIATWKLSVVTWKLSVMTFGSMS